MTSITSIAIAIVGLVALCIVFMIARRILRFAFRAALVVALLIAFGVAGIVFWYSGGSSSNSRQSATRPPAHRTNANR